MDQWTKTSPTSMRLAPYTVAKVTIKEKTFYELWHDKDPLPIGRYSSFEEAKVAMRKERKAA